MISEVSFASESMALRLRGRSSMTGSTVRPHGRRPRERVDRFRSRQRSTGVRPRRPAVATRRAAGRRVRGCGRVRPRNPSAATGLVTSMKHHPASGWSSGGRRRKWTVSSTVGTASWPIDPAEDRREPRVAHRAEDRSRRRRSTGSATRQPAPAAGRRRWAGGSGWNGRSPNTHRMS